MRFLGAPGCREWTEREKRGILSPKDVPCLGAATTSARVTPARHTPPDSLLQQDRSACHQRDPPPVPDHDDQNAGGEEGFHGKPDFREASVLMDTLRRNEVQRDKLTGLAGEARTSQRSTCEHMQTQPLFESRGLTTTGKGAAAHTASSPSEQASKAPLEANAKTHSVHGEVGSGLRERHF